MRVVEMFRKNTGGRPTRPVYILVSRQRNPGATLYASARLNNSSSKSGVSRRRNWCSFAHGSRSSIGHYGNASLCATSQTANSTHSLTKRFAITTRANPRLFESPRRPRFLDMLSGSALKRSEARGSSVRASQAGQPASIASPEESRPLASEVPTMQEAGVPNYNIGSWQAMFSPANTPREVVSRLNAEVSKTSSLPPLRKPLRTSALMQGGGSPEDLAAFIQKEIPRLGRIVRDSGAKVD
jgi:hypothetical protein